MALVALDGTPLVIIGAPVIHGGAGLPSSTNSTLQDAVNEACIMYGYVLTEDSGSHTIDTTGSSSIGWRSGAVTFANAATTLVVGLATMDNATGPPGRATNAADVITPSVSKSHTGGGGTVTANAWQTNVPSTGTLTIANGDLLAFFTQMTARGGVDSVRTAFANVADRQLPGVTSFTAAAYANSVGAPNAIITFNDGTLGFFYGGWVYLTPLTTQTWNSGSVTKEYGNFFQMPFPGKCYGLYAACTVAGNTDFVLYSDPLGTPVAEKTVSVDLNVVAGISAGFTPYLFPSPYTFTANQPLAGIIKPTSVTNVSADYKTFNAAAHQKSETLSNSNCYAINRNTGAFAAQNTNKDRFAMGLLVGAFDNGAGGSSGPVARSLVLQRGTPY